MAFTRVKSPAELEAMRESGRMLATVLDVVKKRTIAGVTTKHLADIAARELKKLGGKPVFLGYYGYPDVICISVNDEVVHGMPGKRVIEEGDIVSLDFGVKYQGMVTDSAISLICGQPKDQKHVKLLQATERAMMAGIDAAHDGVRTGDIGYAVEQVLKAGNYGNVRDLVGHGVGDEMHEDPNVPNQGRKHTGEKLSAGMTIAIEPMATLGTYEVYQKPDGWTIATRDGSWAAHFEHTVAITDDGATIMSQL